MMKPKLYKTEHFIYRQWDRGIDDSIVDLITHRIDDLPKNRSVIIASSKFLLSMGLKVKKASNIIIVSKGKSLITLFYVTDLYKYLKSLRGKINTIIL